MLKVHALRLRWQATAFILITLMAASAGAQRPATSASAEMLLSDEHYDQIVGTTARVAMRSGDAPSAVTVLTDKDIRAMGALTALDVLRYAPGLDVSHMNHADANVSARGFNDRSVNKLLIMVDGRSIYQDSPGSIIWSAVNVPIIRIKRIKIARGPGSALYGANAVLGVINIITKTPEELALACSKTTLRSAVGDDSIIYSEFQASAPATSDWLFTAGAAYNRADGYRERKSDRARDSYTTPALSLSILVNDLFDNKHLEFPALTPGVSNKQVAPQRRASHLLFEGNFRFNELYTL